MPNDKKFYPDPKQESDKIIQDFVKLRKSKGVTEEEKMYMDLVDSKNRMK